MECDVRDTVITTMGDDIQVQWQNKKGIEVL